MESPLSISPLPPLTWSLLVYPIPYPINMESPLSISTFPPITCMYTCTHTNTQVGGALFLEARKGVRTLLLALPVVVSLPVWVLGIEFYSLKEQQVLFTTEPSSDPDVFLTFI